MTSSSKFIEEGAMTALSVALTIVLDLSLNKRWSRREYVGKVLASTISISLNMLLQRRDRGRVEPALKVFRNQYEQTDVTSSGWIPGLVSSHMYAIDPNQAKSLDPVLSALVDIITEIGADLYIQVRTGKLIPKEALLAGVAAFYRESHRIRFRWDASDGRGKAATVHYKELLNRFYRNVPLARSIYAEATCTSARNQGEVSLSPTDKQQLELSFSH